MKQELTDLAGKVKMKMKTVEQESMHMTNATDSSRKRESENKKLVKLVSLLTNKLMRFIN